MIKVDPAFLRQQSKKLADQDDSHAWCYEKGVSYQALFLALAGLSEEAIYKDRGPISQLTRAFQLGYEVHQARVQAQARNTTEGEGKH